MRHNTGNDPPEATAPGINNTRKSPLPDYTARHTLRRKSPRPASGEECLPAESRGLRHERPPGGCGGGAVRKAVTPPWRRRRWRRRTPTTTTGSGPGPIGDQRQHLQILNECHHGGRLPQHVLAQAGERHRPALNAEPRRLHPHLLRANLQVSSPAHYIEKFNLALGQYMGALQSIVPLFIYMNKFYIETKLNRDLKDDLIQLFTDHVADKHIYSLMPLLIEAQSTPFQVTPSTMASIVKGLHTLRPEWVQLAPTLFSKFIPNILPPAMESELQDYAAQDIKLQQELMQNGFARGDQSRKRAGDELAYNGASSCGSSQGYR
uniref:CDK2 associated cullin domain 1 n=1 Tax=Leptobrachium leishanense TaxID=445787 RepID=A0A8C5QAJ5_9ANUR